MTEREQQRKKVLDFLEAHGIQYELYEHPGSVCAFGLINDIEPQDPDPKELFENGHRVKYYIDNDLLNAFKVSFHPCENMASVVISKGDFLKFLDIWGGEVEWLEI